MGNKNTMFFWEQQRLLTPESQPPKAVVKHLVDGITVKA